MAKSGNRRSPVSKKHHFWSVAGTWSRRKIFLELAFHTLEILGIGRGFLLLGDIRPALGIFGIHLKPFFQAGLGIGLDRVGWTFGFAHTAVDALVRMDHQHVVALVEAVYRADFNAIGIFAFNAGFSDDVSHPRLRNGSILRGLRSAGSRQPQVAPLHSKVSLCGGSMPAKFA